MRGISTIVFVLLLCTFSNLSAQNCDPLSPPDVPAAGCACAYPDCNFGLNGFAATLGTLNTAQTFPGCTNNILNNDDWIAFIAGSTTIDITLVITNCQGIGGNGGTGIQAGFYAGCSTPTGPNDEGISTDPLDLQCGCTQNNVNLNYNNFVVGQTYYIVIDGCGGDICDYSIVVNSGSTMVNDPGDPSGIFGPDVLCPGTTATYTTDALPGIVDYDWIVSAGGTIISENGNSITIQWNSSGTISVSGSNACFTTNDVTLPVTVQPLAPLTAQGEYCDNEAGYVYPPNGQLYQAGFHMIDEILTSGPNAGCVQTTNLTVDLNPTYFIDVSRTICEGESVIIGGVPYTQQGTYNISLTTLFTGCDSIIFLDLTVLNPMSIILPPPDLGCTTNQVTINGALSQGDTYNWSTPDGGFICAGNNTPVITACSPGTYCLEVTYFGFDPETGQVTCTDQSCVTVNQDNNAPSITASATNVSCGGADDGTATASVVSGGVGPFIYVWNTNPIQATQTISNLSAGSYTVTITGSNGCTADMTVQVDEPSPIVLDMSSMDAGCSGASTGSATVSPSGGAPGYAYEWNTNPAQMGATANNIPAGNYTVTVTDLNGCSNENSVLVGEATDVTLSIDNEDVMCNNENTGTATANGSGGSGTYTYSWNTNPEQVSQTATGLSAGAYTVVITDSNGCTESEDVTINEPTAIAISTSGTNPDCSSSGDGEVTVTASDGTPGYTYEWNTNPVQMSQTATGLDAGDYTVIVTDANGCTATQTQTLTAPNAINLSTSQTNVLCTGAGTGEATVTATGGTAPLSYSWNDGASQNTPTAVGLTAGTFTVEVTDDNGCTETISVTLTEPAEALSASGTSTDALCGQSNGTIDVTVMGGVSPYDYDWNGAAGNVQDPQNLGPGSYSVIVTDANGCTTTANIMVDSPDSPSATVAITDVTCNGESNGLMDITVSGGIQPYVFTWDPSSNNGNEDLTSAGAGSYSVTVTDDAGCTVVASGVIPEPDVLEATASASPADCGIDNGSVSVVVSGGTSPYSFDWPGTANDGDQSPTGLAAGQYEVTITDDNGCTVTANAEVIIPNGPSTSIVGTDVDCNGEETGTIEITITGGEMPYDIDWGDPNLDGNENLVDLAAGTYQVVVTDVNNCSSVASLEILQPEILVLNASSTPVSCFGSTDGTATATVTGGTGPYTYLWCDGQTGQTANNCIPGPCQVIITDANGCTAETTVIIDEPAEMVVSAAPSDADCNGANTGSIDVTASGGVGGYTYTWTGGIPNNTEDPASLGAATYEVTISDANGCTMVIPNIIINEPEAIAISFTTTEATCNESNGTIDVTVVGGVQPYTYTWTGGLPSQEDPSAVGPGSYDVIVTDANGCTSTETITVTTPDALSISASSSDVDCNGASTGSIDVTISGGISPYTYQWDDGALQITEDAIDLPAGNYTIVVTDGNGCTITTSAEVFEPTAIVLSATSTDATCNQSNGTIDLTVTGGTIPYAFDWSGSAPDQEDPVGLSTGSYDVTVTDANGCTAILSQAVNTPSGLAASAVGSDANCFGENNGSIDLSVSGGTSPFTYLWDDGAAQIIEDPINLVAGNYNVVVTDGEGCTVVASATINEPELLEANGTSSEASCNQANGGIDLTVSGGIAPYSFDWSGTASDIEDPQNLQSGDYDVVVTDANGCTTTASVTVTEPDALVISAIPSDALCNGDASGQIDLSVSGGTGTGTYTYLWDDGASQIIEDPIDLLAGTYTVIVTDGNGCTITQAAVIDEPQAIDASGTSLDALCNQSNGSIDLTVTGGTMPYTFDWSGAAADVEDPQGLQAGSYDVTITDNNGCTFTTSVAVNTPTQLAASAIGSDALCFGEASGSIDLTITGGTAPYDVIWSGGLGTVEDPINVAADNYTAIVTDADGCQIITAASVNEPTVLGASSTSVEATCNESNGSIDLTVTGGTAPYTFTWDGGADPVEDPAGISAGAYSVTITDDNGCTLVYGTDVTTPTALMLSSTTQDANCNGETNGSIDLSVSGGTAPFSYDWNNGMTLEDISNLSAGVYSVIVTDGDGCTITASATINEPEVLVAINDLPANVSCNGGNDGGATIIVSGGTSGYTFDWSDNAFDGQSMPSNMSAGNYTVTVTDGNGCTAVENVVVTEPAAIVLNTSSAPTLCFGSSDGSIDLDVSGGTSPYTFDWNSGAYTDEDPQNITAGNYTVIVTDGNGCTQTTSVQVSQPAVILVNIDNVSNYGGTNVSCSDATDGSAEAFGNGGNLPYSFEWSTGAQTAEVDNLAAGMYTVTLSDANGCTSETQILLDAPTPVNVDVQITDPDCYGENDGVILAEGSGGTGPYMYALDSDDFSAVNQFGGLVSGDYSVVVQDVNGCEQETEASVVDPIELIVDLGPDTIIQMGDSIILDPNVNIGIFALDTFFWKREELDTIYPLVKPLETATYYITVINENGCVDEDEIVVRVQKDRLIYIPNVFTPNEDGHNDYFMIYGGKGVKEVKKFLVFNRWGEVIHEAENFFPDISNTVDFGWDGRLRGEKLNPAVFVYLAEVEFIDGRIEIYKGDVTLMK